MTFDLDIWQAVLAWLCLGQNRRSRLQIKVQGHCMKRVPGGQVTRWRRHSESPEVNNKRAHNTHILVVCRVHCPSGRRDLEWGLSSLCMVTVILQLLDSIVTRCASQYVVCYAVILKKCSRVYSSDMLSRLTVIHRKPSLEVSPTTFATFSSYNRELWPMLWPSHLT